MTNNLLYRQVHPTHCLKELSSGAFRPTPGDKDQLSVDCAKMTTAQDSYELHLRKTKVDKNTGERLYLQTVGTWAISREAVEGEKLSVIPASVEKEPFQPDNLAHHLVDFSSVPVKNPVKPIQKNENVAKRLKADALKNGKLWPR